MVKAGQLKIKLFKSWNAKKKERLGLFLGPKNAQKMDIFHSFY